MKMLKLLIGVLMILLVSGCLVKATVPIMDVSMPPPTIAKKLPLRVAILISDTLENTTITDKPQGDAGWNVTYTFLLGLMLKKSTLNNFSVVFDKIILIKNKPFPSDIDFVIIPTIENFRYRFKGMAIEVNTSVKIVVLDNQGVNLFEFSGNKSGENIYKTSVSSMNEAAGLAAAESMEYAIQEIVEAMAMSPEINAYAQKSSNSFNK